MCAHGSPFLFITHNNAKCLQVDGNAGMSYHFHYYSPNINVGGGGGIPPQHAAHAERWNEMRRWGHRHNNEGEDPRHHHHRAHHHTATDHQEDMKFKSGLHNIHENIQRHAKLVTAMNDNKNEESESPLSHLWQRYVQKLKATHVIAEEDTGNHHLRISIHAGPMKYHRQYEITTKSGTIQHDAYELGSIQFCFLCTHCSSQQPLMIAVDIDEMDIHEVQSVKRNIDSTHKLLKSLHDTHETVKEYKEKTIKNSTHDSSTSTSTTPELEKAKQEFDTHQHFGKTHLSYMKHELSAMTLHLDMEVKKA